MAHVWGINVWGIGPDAANSPGGVDWVDLIGGIEITEGDFSPLQSGTPHAMRAHIKTDAAVMASDINMNLLKQVTIGFKGPCGTDTPADFAHQYADDDWERIVFRGDNGDYTGDLPGPPDGMIQANYVGQDSEVLGIRPRVSADASIGVAGIINAIAAEISGDIDIKPNGVDAFPDAISGYELDLPASGDASIATIMQPATAGYAMWVCFEWIGDYDTDVLQGTLIQIRPSVFASGWVDGGADGSTSQRIEVPFPWIFRYSYGQQWGNHPDRVRVNGTASHTGVYAAGSSFGTVDVRTVTTLINNDTECDSAAEHVLSSCLRPHPRIMEMLIRMEDCYRDLVRRGVDPDDAQAVLWKLGAARVGDTIQLQSETFDPLEALPLPSGSNVTQDQLDAVVAPFVTVLHDGTPAGTDLHSVASVTRSWDPHNGWIIKLGLRIRAGTW